MLQNVTLRLSESHNLYFHCLSLVYDCFPCFYNAVVQPRHAQTHTSGEHFLSLCQAHYQLLNLPKSPCFTMKSGEFKLCFYNSIKLKTVILVKKDIN